MIGTMTVREINAIVRAANGRNVYLSTPPHMIRIIGARTHKGQMQVKALSSGMWLAVWPDHDTIEVR